MTVDEKKILPLGGIIIGILRILIFAQHEAAQLKIERNTGTHSNAGQRAARNDKH